MSSISILDRISKELPKKTEANIGKVLFTHSFSIYQPCYVHDRLMAYTLKLRGFDIYATFCDGIQDIECNVYGGVWGEEFSFDDKCASCQEYSRRLWSFLDDAHIFKYSQYLNGEDISSITIIMDSVSEGEWLYYENNGIKFGKLAKEILINNYVVGNHDIIPNHEKLGRNHLKNLLLVYLACKKIICELKPDRIISNDSFYGMWKIWEVLAKENKIPFYSHWSGTRKGTWCYAHDNAAMSFDFSSSWANYSKKELTQNEEQRVNQWLEDRIVGKEMLVDMASLSSFKNEDFDLSKINETKPIALLSANLIWDLTALGKETFTKSMNDWVIKTIDWFSKNPECQLIIKAHPAEQFPKIPSTKESLESIIQQNYKTLPKNVFFLSPKASITIYDLLPLTSLGLVYTTTAGFEMAARGIPVITAGESHYRGLGFTIDPTTVVEYEKALEDILIKKKSIDKSNSINLAKKFIKFNFFHYFTKIDLFSFEFKKDVSLSINSLDELHRGNFSHWDYIVDKIEQGKPILTKTEWPKES